MSVIYYTKIMLLQNAILLMSNHHWLISEQILLVLIFVPTFLNPYFIPCSYRSLLLHVQHTGPKEHNTTNPVCRL